MSMSYSLSVPTSSRVQYHTNQYRSRSYPFNPIFDVSFSRKTNSQNFVACNVSLGGFGNSLQKRSESKRNFVVCSIEAGNPLPSSGPPSGHWKGWVLGIIVSVILPLATGKLGPLSLIKDKFDIALQKVENIVETIEKVAGGVEKTAEHLLDELPDGELKKLVAVVEHIAEKAARDADRLDDVIDLVQEKAEELDKQIDAIEKMKPKESIVVVVKAEEQKLEEHLVVAEEKTKESIVEAEDQE